MAEEYPKTAYILTLVGAILALIIGIPLSLLGAVISVVNIGAGIICVILPLLGGILGIISAILMKNPEKAKMAGGLAILAAILSIYSFIGFILLLIGGIMAITWKPPAKVPPPAPPPPPM